MNYKIHPIDIKNPEIEEKLRMLIKDAFQTKEPIPPGHLLKNTTTPKASNETAFLAAFENGEMIGCNGFMSTDFVFNGKISSCYQSCWSATHPKHQGKKVFVNIINEGKNVLKEKGAGFIYGVPNNNSHPIFTKKLGFKEIPSVMIKIPNIPYLRDSYFTKKTKNIESFKSATFYPLEDQIIDLKKNMPGEDVIEITENRSILWGKLKTSPSKFGIKLNYFYVGGMELFDTKDLKRMLDQVFRRFNVRYIQIVSCKNNLYNDLVKGWKPTQMNGFIFYELNAPVENVNIFYGVIDVF
jgi:predicted N-acetyltransferase YhbS